MKRKKNYAYQGIPSLESSAWSQVSKRIRKTYQEFIADFHSMTENELQKWDVLYSETHYRTFNVLNSMYSKDKFASGKDYQLLEYPSDTKKLYEGEIWKLPEESVVRMLTREFIKKCPDNMLYAPDWCKPIHTAGQHAAEAITKFFPLSPKQMGIETIGDLEAKRIWMAIPDVKDNKELIKKAMSFFGYYIAEDRYDNYRSEVYDTKWSLMTFEPYFSPYVNEHIFAQNDYLYHVSPTKYEHKILKQGLVPYSKNLAFNYPNRVYLILKQRDTADQEHHELTTDEIISASKMLLDAKLIRCDDYVNDYLYTVYRIELAKLPVNIKFSFDTNYWPLGLFTADNITASAITIVEHIDLSKPKPIKRIIEL